MTVEFGLALENFTPERKVPDMDAITAYSATAEELGFASVWAWDHLFLGARRPFPFLEALTTLSWVARGPAGSCWAPGSSCCRSGSRPSWPRRRRRSSSPAAGGSCSASRRAGTSGSSTPPRCRSAQRGQIFERNLDLMLRLWAEDDVTGEWDGRVLSHVRMLPLPRPRPQVLIGGYVDRVLRRVATRSRRLGDVLLHPALDRRGVARIRGTPRRPAATRMSSTWSRRCRCASATPRRRPPAGKRVRRRLLRRAGLERGDAGIAVRGTPRAVRRADRRLPRRRGQGPGVLPVQLRARAGAAARRRGAAAARTPGWPTDGARAVWPPGPSAEAAGRSAGPGGQADDRRGRPCS